MKRDKIKEPPPQPVAGITLEPVDELPEYTAPEPVQEPLEKEHLIVFLSGPVVGYDKTERALLYKSAELLILRKLSSSYDVRCINPIESFGLDSWQSFMRDCIKAVTEANVLCRLPGADSAQNCALEASIAEALEIQFMDYLEFYKEPGQ